MEDQEHGTNRMCSECRNGRKCLTSWCVVSRLEDAELRLQAVRLALASVFGKGHETRDHVELAAAVVGEVCGLRGKLAESETWRTELRQEMDAVKGKLREVTGQRDAAVNAYVKQTDGRMPTYCPCCGGESLCDGCEPGCALADAIEAVFPGATR